MLKKLFVHEWKDTWKVPALLNVVVVCLTILGVLVIRDGIWDLANENVLISSSLVIYMMTYFASVLALCMVISIYFWLRFYKNLYADPGYLMHTLPVTSNDLILSKLFANAIWSLVSTIVSASSFVMMLNVLADGRILAEFKLAPLMEAFEGISDGEVAKLVLALIMLLAMVTGSFMMSILLGYAAVSIGQLFKKHRVGGAVMMYFALHMAFQTLVSFVMVPIQYLLVDPADSFMSFIGVQALIALVTWGGAIAFYCITHHIMNNKLNLE